MPSASTMHDTVGQRVDDDRLDRRSTSWIRCSSRFRSVMSRRLTHDPADRVVEVVGRDHLEVDRAPSARTVCISRETDSRRRATRSSKSGSHRLDAERVEQREGVGADRVARRRSRAVARPTRSRRGTALRRRAPRPRRTRARRPCGTRGRVGRCSAVGRGPASGIEPVGPRTRAGRTTGRGSVLEGVARRAAGSRIVVIGDPAGGRTTRAAGRRATGRAHGG